MISYLHVKYSLKIALSETQHHQYIWIPLEQWGLGENCGSFKEISPFTVRSAVCATNIRGLLGEPWEHVH